MLALVCLGCGAHPGPGAAAPRGGGLDAGPADAGPADAGPIEVGPIGAGPIDAATPARSAEYHVVVPARREVASVPRDAVCSEHHASCDASDCFRIDDFTPRPAAPPALERCTRDSECTALYTVCCDREGVDVRALRTDSVDRWRARLCGEPRTCGEDAAVLATLRVSCIEARCRLVEAVPDALCAAPDATFRVIVPGSPPRLASHPRDLSCALGAPFCDPAHDCLAVAELGPPEPPPSMTRCSRDSDCVVESPSCCECGAIDFRPLRRDALDRWRRCSPLVACPECIGQRPALLPACIQGVCRALRAP